VNQTQDRASLALALDFLAFSNLFFFAHIISAQCRPFRSRLNILIIFPLTGLDLSSHGSHFTATATWLFFSGWQVSTITLKDDGISTNNTCNGAQTVK
jgi:hypothetical protein